ncbi:MAG: PKD domain-containing protein [Bacteroidales bacterium]|nr:PKD domain-containing protein [Bacteroidales bacterium]
MKICAFLFFLWVCILFGQIPTSGLIAWYMADSVVEVAGRAQILKDNSGNGYHLQQNTVANQPFVIQNGLNYHKVLRFSGNQWMEKDFGTNYNQPVTIFLIFNITNNTGLHFIFDWYSPRFTSYLSSNSLYQFAGIGGFFLSYFSTFPFILLRLEYNGANSKIVINESILTVGHPGTNHMAGFLLGRASFTTLYNLIGDVAEILIYNRILTLSEITSVRNYLYNKYAPPPVNLGPDKNINYGFCPVTLTADSGYVSYLWSTGATSRSIQVTKSGTYWVEAKDIFNRISRDTINVSFPFIPMRDTLFCLGDTITVTPQLTGFYHIYWNDTIYNNSLNIFKPGQYRVKIVDTTISSCFIVDTFVVGADSLSYYFTLGQDTSVCQYSWIQPEPYNGQISKYLWSTGDTTNKIRINSAGLYWCEVKDPFGCKARDSIYVSLRGKRPVTAFVADTVCYGDSTTLYNLSYAFTPEQIAHATWYIPGIDTIYQTHSFSSPFKIRFLNTGYHPIKLVVVTDSGCIGDTIQNVKIRQLPVANFKPLYACSRKPALFSDQSHSSEGFISGWSWIINEDTVQGQSFVYYEFDSIGYYPVTLIVQNSLGCRNSVTKPVLVRETPRANFFVDESCFGQPVYFFDSTVVSPFAYVESRMYNFGDGNTSSFANPSHIYDSVGQYTVTYWVKSVNGCSDTITKTIIVHPFPVLNYSYTLPCEKKNICFSDSSWLILDSIKQVIWIIEGDTLEGKRVCYFLQDTSTIHVNVKVYSNFECMVDSAFVVKVNPTPYANFDVQPEYGTPPLDVQCFNYSIGATSYAWFFGDNGFSSDINPLHTYTQEGIYFIQLIAYNNAGCSDTAWRNVYVIPSILDLIITELSWKDSLGFVYPSFIVYNNSTRRIRSIALDAQIERGFPIRETWKGVLNPGETLEYHFHAGLGYNKDESITLCGYVEALDVPGQEDMNPSNNFVCTSNARELFLMQPFPNPSQGNISFDLFLPESGSGFLFVYDIHGRKIKEYSFTATHSGMLRIDLSLNDILNSLYYMCVEFNTERICLPFIISR